MPRPRAANPTEAQLTIERVETMLAVAPFHGVSLADLEAARRRLADHEAMFDAAEDWLASNEAERLMALDIAELANAYKRMARAVERGGEA